MTNIHIGLILSEGGLLHLIDKKKYDSAFVRLSLSWFNQFSVLNFPLKMNHIVSHVN